MQHNTKLAAIEAYLEHQCRKFGAAQADHYRAIATHEAAHIVAGLACNAAVLEVEINPPRTRKAGGEVNIAGLLPHHDSFICLAGWAWEEAHGDTSKCPTDLRQGKGEDSKNFERNMHTARVFVRDAEPVIKACAAAVMWGLNTPGKVGKRKLVKILDYVQPHALKHEHLIG